MYKLFSNLLIVSLFLMGTGCIPPEQLFQQTQSNPIYVFGDGSYDELLQKGTAPIKRGPIPIQEVPAEFPVKILETDGSYAGGHIYRNIREAEQGIMQAKAQGIIAEDSAWGVYQLEGNWNDYAYELKPNEFYLNKSAKVLKRVK